MIILEEKFKWHLEAFASELFVCVFVILDPIDYHYIHKNILQYIFFCVPQKKERQRGLEWHEGEYIIKEFSFLNHEGQYLMLLFVLKIINRIASLVFYSTLAMYQSHILQCLKEQANLKVLANSQQWSLLSSLGNLLLGQKLISKYALLSNRWGVHDEVKPEHLHSPKLLNCLALHKV